MSANEKIGKWPSNKDITLEFAINRFFCFCYSKFRGKSEIFLRLGILPTNFEDIRGEPFTSISPLIINLNIEHITHLFVYVFFSWKVCKNFK